MSLIVSAGGSNIAPIEPGTYPAVCYGIIDLGEQYSESYDKWTQKVLLLWEMPGEKIDLGGETPVSRTISKQYTMSINEKASLRKDLAAWRGRDFTPEELKAFDLHSIIGAPCLLNIIHREGKSGGTFANIAAIMKMAKGMATEKPTLPHIVFDLDTDPLSMLDEMPEWIKSMIVKSRTYQSRIAPKTDVGAEDFEIDTDALDRADEYDDDDEDVPF